jgi:hypothetical protein
MSRRSCGMDRKENVIIRAITYSLALALGLISAPQVTAKSGPSRAQIAASQATPEIIAAQARVTNDPFSKSIEIDTLSFYRERGGLLQVVTSDEFLRAFVDKKTGEASLQIYFSSRYLGDWIFYDRLAFIGGDGPQSVQAVSVTQETIGCSAYSCEHLEDVSAEIPVSVLRAATLGTGPAWAFKVIGSGGQGVERGFLKTEIAGFLLAVERERSKAVSQNQ